MPMATRDEFLSEAPRKAAVRSNREACFPGGRRLGQSYGPTGKVAAFAVPPGCAITTFSDPLGAEAGTVKSI